MTRIKLLPLLFLFFSTVGQAKDFVFMISNLYNGLASPTAFLYRALQKANKNLQILPIDVNTLEEARETLVTYRKVGLLKPEDRVRGLAFVGHGNRKHFALTVGGPKFSGEQAAALVFDILKSEEKLPPHLTIYFAGCDNGFISSLEKSDSALAFQYDFSESLTRDLKSINSTSVIDVIAPSFTSGTFSFFRPTWIDHIVMKSGVGALNERFTLSLNRWVNTYSDKTVWATLAIAGMIAQFTLNGKPATEVSLSLIGSAVISVYLRTITEKWGQLSGPIHKRGFIRSLLNESLRQSCTETIEKLQTPAGMRPALTATHVE